MAEEIVLTGPKTSLQDELSKLYSQGFLTDITLSTEDGKNFEAHRILLAARSHYFHSIVPRLKSEAVIFLKGVKGAHLDKILKYIYSGSVSLSRHQLKPILEVAKSLQVKGLYDANPTEILSRQGAASSSSALASRSGGNHPNVQAAMAARAQHKLASPGSMDKTTSTSFKSSASTSAAMAASRSSRSNKMPPLKSVADDSDEDSDDEIVLNRSRQTDKDDLEDDEEDGEGDDNRSDSPPKVKRKRGRPPKMKRGDDRAGSSKDDPYEFDADESGAKNDESSSKSGKAWRVSGGKKHREEGKSDDDESLSLSKREKSKYATSAINGKHVLNIKCLNNTAELHLSRFANGMRGNSIKYKEKWMTPQEFEEACGATNKKYLENIQTDYGPLKTLTASGMLKPHSRKCRCSICRGEETSPKMEMLKRGEKRPKEEDLNDPDDDEEHNAADGSHDQGDHDGHHSRRRDGSSGGGGADDEGHHSSHRQHSPSKEKEGRSSSKKKKKKHSRNDEWRKQLLAEQLKQETSNSQQQQQQQAQAVAQAQAQAHAQAVAQQQTGAVLEYSFDHQDQQLQHQQHPQQQQQHIIQPNGGEIYVTAISGINAPMVSTISDMPPKISPSAMLPDRIEPPQHVQPPAFYVMSPHPHMNPAPPTPQHNPFPNMGPPASPAPSTTSSVMTSPTPSIKSKDGGGAGGSSSGGAAASTPRMGPVMNVRCKSTTAVLYTNKYESGSKGKCIQLGDEWLTPNEFEDRAGSKAKKYLSSIKCLGRPLRVFVNSGELKGSTPPVPTKPPKKVKPTTMQPIAPAPPSSGPVPQIAMQPIASAPPTPSHISSAPPIPANLGMMMGAPNQPQPPILINQTTSMASTIMGNQHQVVPIISIPMDVRQNVSQAM